MLTVASPLGRRLLVAIVVGSGIAATQLSPNDVGLQLLENSLTTALGLAVLILVFGPVSGAHFNPVVSAADWWIHRRTGGGLAGRDLAPYITTQILGGIGGAILASLTYALPAVTLSATTRSSGHLWMGETVTTAGLILVIFALVRTRRTGLVAPAVGAYIGAAYWFTSSTSFANPAVTIGRVFTDTFAGVNPTSVPAFLAAQVVGAIIGIGVVLALYPTTVAPAAEAIDPVLEPAPRGLAAIQETTDA